MVIFHSYVSLPEGRKGRHGQKKILHDLGLAGLCIIGDRNDQYDPAQGMYESAKRDQLMCILASGSYLALNHRIGWWENLQESPIFDGKNHGFL